MSASGHDSPGRASPSADARDDVQLRLYPDLIKALAMVKLAAARAGVDCGTIRPEVLQEIERACLEIIDGKRRSPFPLDLFQDGGDAALRVAMALGNRRLITAIKELIASFRAKGQEFGPITPGPELSALAEILAGEVRTLDAVQRLLCDITVGATATGLHAPIGYAQRCATHLANVSGLPLSLASDGIEAAPDPFSIYSSCLKRLAITLSTVCNDLRLLASVPRSGRREFALPPKPPGSPISPGTAKPMVPGMTTMFGPAALNVVEPAIAACIFEAQTLFINAVHVLRLQCVDGITANPDIRRHDADSMLMAFALAAIPGLDGHAAPATSPGQPDWLFTQTWPTRSE